MGKVIKVKNARVMVNFETKKILHTFYPMNSEEYRSLIRRGFERVGMIKGEAQVFWNDEYFKPYARYEKHD